MPGSESSGVLKRRLHEREAGRGLSHDPLRQTGAHVLEVFFAQQQQRVERVADRQVERVRQRQRELQQRQDRGGTQDATHQDVITSFHIEIRGSCGSDAHTRRTPEAS